ncbi:MAG: DNA methylase [Clostridia bacterium]|nr:DNA methylase [Clostridia bacterium]
MHQNTYAAIDLKSFYASVECVERGLDPFGVNLVVADPTRTEKTICLAVSPSLKGFGVPSRPRLFEVNEKLKDINARRRVSLPGKQLLGKSVYRNELMYNPHLAIDYITAPPRMALYMKYSSNIYGIYLKYISPDDIFPYSIDEVFIDLTEYLETYHTTAQDLVTHILHEVYRATGITATAGIGTNMYLCKVAMDIVAKKSPPDKNGVRIASLDELSYRKLLWDHRPITDFWRVGRGYAKKLEEKRIYTMGDVARRSLTDEDMLYRLFGVNAELLIDHAWGFEPCTMEEVKAYRPKETSLSAGQVLSCPYTYEKGRIILMEMSESLSLDLVEKGLATDSLTLTVSYDGDSLKGACAYEGDVTLDHYGRAVPKHAHGTKNLGRYTSSTKEISEAFLSLYSEIVNKSLLIRRFNLTALHLQGERMHYEHHAEQLDIFSITEEGEEGYQSGEEQYEREKNLQKALIDIKKKHGKNAIVKGMSFEEGATAMERNEQIGGHKA